MGGRVFVFGSINTDLVIYVARLPIPGETVSGGTFAMFPGGKGANQAVAAARAGARVVMYGCLGDDLFGRQRLAALAEAGISTGAIRVLAGVPSGVAQIAVDTQGENTIAVAPGANERFAAAGIEVPRAGSGERAVSLFQNEVPQAATEELVARAKAAGHTVVWNLAPTVARRPEPSVLGKVDYLVCNRNELAAVTGSTAAEAARLDEGELARRARGLAATGVGAVLVTLGAAGSFLAAPSGELRQPAFRVEAVDTVGAGDCFCGVLAASLADGLDAAAGLRRASAAAAISATRRGAQDSMPFAREIEEFLAKRG